MFTTVLRGVLLVLGAASIVASGMFTLGHLDDRTIFAVLIPGFVVGLVLIAAAVWGGKIKTA